MKLGYILLIIGLQLASCGHPQDHDGDKKVNVPANPQDPNYKSSKFEGMNAAFSLVFAQIDSDLNKNSKLSLQQFDEHIANLQGVKKESDALIPEIKTELLNTTDRIFFSKYLESISATIRYNERASVYLERNLFQ